MFINKRDRENYLANRRIAVIQKARKPLHMQIKLINNRLVDKKILEWDDEFSTDITDPYSSTSISSQIIGYNKIATSKDLQRVLKKSIVSSNPRTRAEAMKVLNDVSEIITKTETERIIKNLDYVENILTNANVDIEKYNALVDRLPQSTPRKEVIERCILQGNDLPANPRQAFLERALERGENYKGRQYSYKELDKLSRDLERYKTNRLDYEKSIMENKQAYHDGFEKVNQTKTWISSNAEKTRHESMDGDTVPLSSKFEVVNDNTGDVDFLLFPGDIASDHNNCSNICNCLCSYEIN